MTVLDRGNGVSALVRLLSSEPDRSSLSDPGRWELLTQHSASYGVSTLVAFTGRPHTSAEQRAWCDNVLTRNWRRYAQGIHHLQTILTILDQAEIRALVLKGPLLAQRHYQPPFLRKSSVDIDLAVKEEDIERACQALAEVGYIRTRSLLQSISQGYDVALLHETLPRVELHFRLTHGPLGIPVDEFFERSVATTLPNGRTAYVLSATDEILHLVLHYAHHRFPLLFNLYEIRRIWSAAPLEVRSEVCRKAIQHHFWGAFIMTDIAFRSVWGEPFLPANESSPKTWLHWRLNEKLYRQCAAWSAPGFKLSLTNRLRGRWLDFQITDRPSDALRFFSMFGSVAWYRLRNGGWRTLKYRHFAGER
ncbi:MAG: hypothetical protein QOJ99_2227 [Bryobacterales bacterium]|jgi:hypothetical protein|nr:hypothetical protein [Bryobacterales bacterium]